MRPDTLLTSLGVLALLLALLPLAVAWRNLRVFGSPTVRPPRGVRVSVLIPARDEASGIGRAVRSALASRGVAIEVLVLDDQSGDDTARIVAEIAALDPRVRLIPGAALPPGWTGKQRACWLLAAQASHEVLMFVDASVELRPRAAAAAAGLLLQDGRLGLVSGLPRPLGRSWAERLAASWQPLGLLGYLPLGVMRETLAPALAAGCGQWMTARRRAYLEVNGHGAEPSSRHDGASLPRSFRAAGWKTDVFDGWALARSHRDRRLREVWQGLGRMAGEGPGLTGPVGPALSAGLLLGGHVLPWLLLPWALLAQAPLAALLAGLGIAADLALRLLVARRRPQPLDLALHAPAAAGLAALQLGFLLRRLARRPVHWRGRVYAPAWRHRSRPRREAREAPQARQAPATRPPRAEPQDAPQAASPPAEGEASASAKAAAA